MGLLLCNLFQFVELFSSGKRRRRPTLSLSRRLRGIFLPRFSFVGCERKREGKNYVGVLGGGINARGSDKKGRRGGSS